MVDINKLKGKIVENGLTIEKLAKCFIKQFTIKMHQNNATNATKGVYHGKPNSEKTSQSHPRA
jgi:hypothetical protein